MRLLIAFVILSGVQVAWSKGNCLSRDIELEKTGFQVQVSKFQTENENQKSILIVPPTGGTNFMDRSYAKFFCENGYDVFILNHWTDDDEYSLDLQIHERFYSRAQQAVELTLSYINSRFIGVLGTSVGAIHAVNAIQSFSKIDAAFLIVGGGPIPEVIANSDQEVLVQARQRRFELYSFKNINEYIQILRKNLTFNSFKKSANPHLQVGMVIADADTTMPTKNQIELQSVLAPKKILHVDGNHLFAILKTWLCYKTEIVHFFELSRTNKYEGEIL